MFAVSFVLRGVMSEEGGLVVEHYDRDTRPENLHSIHTFQTDADAMTYVHSVVRPLFPPDVSRVGVAGFLGDIERDLEASKLYADGGQAQQQIEDAVEHLNAARMALTRHLTAGSTPA